MKDIFSPNQRMIILHEMEKDITLSNEMAQRLLREYGHSVGIQEVNKQFVWLEERGLITVEKMTGTLWVGKVTVRGKDVALGNIREDGVEVPIEE